MLSAFKQHGDWVEEAQEFYDLHSLGLSAHPTEMSAPAFSVLRMMRQHEALVNAQLQGAETAKLIYRLFSDNSNAQHGSQFHSPGRHKPGNR